MDKGKGETGHRNSAHLVLNMTFYSPASVKLHMGIKETDNRSRGGVPAVYSGSDQALPLAVPHNLHQAWVAFVYILVQVEFQLH